MSKKYIYIDNSSKGLFAYVWGVMNALHHLKEGDVLYVNLNQMTPYFDPNYQNTKNVWEYYFKQPFDQITDLENYEVIELHSLGPLLFALDGEGNYGLSPNSRFYEERTAQAKTVLQKYFKLQSHVLDKIENFYSEYMEGKKVLGIHYRGGEAFHHGHGKFQFNKMDLQHHYDWVDKYIDDYDKLLLITNDEIAKNSFTEKYGQKLIRYDCDLLCPPGDHRDLTWLHCDRNYEKGEFATIECILFSKCDKLLATSSNLGCLSILISNGNFEYIDSNVQYI